MLKNANFFLCIVSVLANPQIAAAEPIAVQSEQSNQQVLDDWNKQSGQGITLSDSGTLEWHGEVTTDIYNVETRSANNPNPTLSGLQQGNFQLTRFQGDLRTSEEGEAVNYIQGGISVTNDRAVQSNYTTQINTLQAGRAGVGYQIAAGDVVASFSQLGSNLGLRGVSGAWQINAATLYGYTGRVTNTWEALLKRPTINGVAARPQFLREVSGGKLEYQYNNAWQFFGTAQTYQDLRASISAPLAVRQNTQEGTTGTVGAKYQTEHALVTAETGVSRFSTSQDQTKEATDQALMVDASYRWQTVGLRAGYHDLGVQYTSLAQAIAPGIKDAYLGGDWSILPNLNYATEARRSEARYRNFFDDSVIKNTVDTLTNSISYSFTKLPGLNVALLDSRNWGKNDASTSKNSNTQISSYYAVHQYNASLLLGVGEFKNSQNPESNSDTETIQIGLGRQVLAGEIRILPTISLNIQVNGGYTRQRLESGMQTKTNFQGVNLSSQVEAVGQLSFYLQNLDTTQTDGGPSLNTKIIHFDWKKAFTDAFSLSAYARGSFLNHGEKALYVDEKIVGIEADYLW